MTRRIPNHSLIQNRWLAIATFGLVAACGGNTTAPVTPGTGQGQTTQPNGGPTSPTTLSPSSTLAEKKYWLKTAECETGNHVFRDQDTAVVLEQYCGTLIDDKANNSCADEARLNLFMQECKSIAAKFPTVTLTETGETIIADAPHQMVVSSAGQVEVKLLNLWADKTKMLLSAEKITDLKTPEELELLAPEETLEFVESEKLLAAVKDCGLNYMGPGCLQFQGALRVASGLQTQPQAPVYFQVVNYPGFTNQFLWAFPVQINGDEFTIPSALLYLVKPGLRGNLISNPDLKSGNFIAVATFEVSNMDKMRAYGMLTRPQNIRQLVYLSRYLKLGQLLESDIEETNSQIYQQLKKSRPLLDVELEPQQIIDYLQLLEEVVGNEEAYQVDLQSLVESPNQQVAIEGALCLALYQPKNPKILKKISSALVNQNPATVLKAINIVKQQPTILLKSSDQKSLINLLQNSNAPISDGAYELLNLVGVDAATLPQLATLLTHKNQPDNVREKAFWLASTLATSEAKTAMVQSLLRFSDQYLPDQYALLASKISALGLSDLQTPSLTELLNHRSIDVREQAVNWFIDLNSEKSLGTLIESFKNDSFEVVQYMFDRLEILDLDKEYVPLLVKQWNTIGTDDVVRGVIRLLDKNKSAESKLALIDKMSVSKEAFREDIIGRLDQTSLSGVHAPKLGEQLLSAYVSTKNAALLFLSRIKAIEATKVLVENMGIDDKPLRLELLRIVADRDLDKTLIPPLKTNLLNKNFPEVVLASIALLGKIGTQESLREIIPGLCASDSEVRNAVFHQLFANDPQPLLAHLVVNEAMRCKFTSVRQGAVNYLDRMADSTTVQAMIRFVGEETDLEIRQDLMKRIDSKVIDTGANYWLNSIAKSAKAEEVQIYLTRLFDKVVTIAKKNELPKRAIEVDADSQNYVLDLLLTHPSQEVRKVAKEILDRVKLRFGWSSKTKLLDMIKADDKSNKKMAIDYLLNMAKTSSETAVDQGPADDLQGVVDALDKQIAVEADPELKNSLEAAKGEIAGIIAVMRQKLPKALANPTYPYPGYSGIL